MYTLTHICDDELQYKESFVERIAAENMLKHIAANTVRENLQNIWVWEDLPETDEEVCKYGLENGHIEQISDTEVRCFDLDVITITEE